LRSIAVLMTDFRRVRARNHSIPELWVGREKESFGETFCQGKDSPVDATIPSASCARERRMTAKTYCGPTFPASTKPRSGANPWFAGVTAIAAGAGTGFALMPDGTVRTWEDSEFGQLGNNSAALLSDVPVPVSA